MRAKVSVLINTLNEENNIGACLEMLTWADEIVVVDQYSDDKTVEIARNYTDKIYLQERKGYASREFGYTKLKYDWILIVDADELIPARLTEEYRRVADNDLADVVIVPRKSYGFGKLIEHGRWNCLFDMQVRFGKKKAMILSDIAHLDFTYLPTARQIVIKDEKLAIAHFAHLDFEQFIGKMNTYTTFEANNIFDGRKKQFGLAAAFFKGVRGFVKGYFVLGGYKDGFRGLAIHLLDFMYILMTYIKSRLVTMYGSKAVREMVNKDYMAAKQALISEYKSASGKA
jgi:glycosyltransferase involved in cell wall biosynthesis